MQKDDRVNEVPGWLSEAGWSAHQRLRAENDDLRSCICWLLKCGEFDSEVERDPTYQSICELVDFDKNSE